MKTGQLINEDGVDTAFIELRMSMVDAVAHQSARTLEQPGALQEFLLGRHGASSRYFFTIELGDECPRGRHQGSL